MFVGHYGPSLGLRHASGGAPLWVLFLAAQFVDIVWSVLFIGAAIYAKHARSELAIWIFAIVMLAIQMTNFMMPPPEESTPLDIGQEAKLLDCFIECCVIVKLFNSFQNPLLGNRFAHEVNMAHRKIAMVSTFGLSDLFRLATSVKAGVNERDLVNHSTSERGSISSRDVQRTCVIAAECTVEWP